MPFLLCNILFAFPLFLHISSLVFCTSPWILCLKIGFMLIFMQVLCGGFFLFCFDLWDFSQKMTCCFLQSDVLFCIKRRVVFFKVTCRFHQNDVLFSVHALRWRNHSVKRHPKAKILNCKKIRNSSFSRAHALARITGVFLFLLSQVSHCNS